MNIFDLPKKELENYFKTFNDKPFRATQIYEWLYQKKCFSFAEMSNLKKDLIDKLCSIFEIELLNLVTMQKSKDGTIKFLLKLNDGNLIETVLMQHDYGKSICVTTQVGCNMGCAFCASGLNKKIRNLETYEIVSQIMTVESLINEKVTHVVVMGIGEPFDNYENVMRFVRIINDPKGLAIGARHITISTSGLVPRIYDYANEGIQTNLAISLHAPNDEIRSQIMRINRKYSIKEVIKAMDDYIAQTNRRVTIEYILLDKVNDMPACAYELAELLYKKNVYVNLIPYNEVSEMPFKRSTKEAMNQFYDILKKRGTNVTLRREQGHDIDAACGQLRSKNIKK